LRLWHTKRIGANAMTKTRFFISTFFVTTLLASLCGADSTIENFVGKYKAACQGTGPEGLKDQWQWTIRISHNGDDGKTHPESLYADFSTKNQDNIWIVTFTRPNEKPTPTYEDSGLCNVTVYSSKLSGTLLQGNVDSAAIANAPDCKAGDLTGGQKVFQAHWKSEMDLSSGKETFHMVYQGYNAVEDPNYEYLCHLIKM
jgi:hypothetical protein